MDNMDIVAYDGAKAVTIWSDEGWAPIGATGEVEKDSPAYLAAAVAWLYRCNRIAANAVASIPFDIVRVKDNQVVDSTADWQNKLEIMPHPEKTMWLIASAQGLSGKAYFLKAANSSGYLKKLRYLSPGSVRFELKDDGSFVFKRKVGNQDVAFPPAVDQDEAASRAKESIAYLWMPDPDVELGPPLKFPGKAALAAAGVVANLDTALQGYFQRGMIKVTAFSVPANTPPGEKERFENKVRSFLSGVRNSFRTIFLRADKITPVIMGEGLGEMQNNTLVTEKREDMAAAYGIPFSKLLSSAVGGLGGSGVVESDDRDLIMDCALPWWKDIARELNRQVFEPMGYRMVERHETMELFQAVERSRSDALVNYVNAFSTEPELAAAWAEVLGLKIPPEAERIIQAYIQKKEQRRAEMSPLRQGASPGPGAAADDLRRWQRKALKRVGQPCEFVSERIPAAVNLEIARSLPDCGDEGAVRALFAGYIDGAG